MSNMTIEKAIEYWKARYENTKYFDDVHCDADELREHKEYVEALKETITELEKQLPKKVIWENARNGEIYYLAWACCPNCQTDICGEPFEECEFCSNCGQALDWSDENE